MAWLEDALGTTTVLVADNESARQLVSAGTPIPTNDRAALLEEFDGPDDADFTECLAEWCHDRHFAPLPGGQTLLIRADELVAHLHCPVRGKITGRAPASFRSGHTAVAQAFRALPLTAHWPVFLPQGS